jgi:hypothetical protein
VGNRGLARRTATAALAIVAVLCAGCGGGGSRGGAGAPAPTTTRVGPRVAALTQVLTFQALDDRGLLPGLVRVQTVPGVCAGGSLVLSGRADAWRCAAGATMLDPCFSAEGSAELACVPDPFTPNATVVQVTGPMPRGNRNDPGHPPWFLELADGTRCGPLSPGVDPAATVQGRHPSYSCADGSVVFGDPDGLRPVWTAQVGSVSGGAVLATVEVTTAWY